MKQTIFSLTLLLGSLFFGHTLPTEALTVSPAKIEISGDPGSRVVGSISLYNEKDRAQTFYSSAENFEPGDDSGVPIFVGANGGLATWLETEAQVTLEAKERRTVPFTLTIPENVEAGGYFAAQFYGTQAPDPESGAVGIGGRIGVLMLLRVNGDIPEEGGLLEYGRTDNTMFYTTPPVTFEYRFSNDGGDRVVPRGEITISDMFGGTKAMVDANPKEGSVLPGSARRFTIVWNEEGLQQDEAVEGEERAEPSQRSFFQTVAYQFNNFHIGKYTADLNLGWGFTNQLSKGSLSFYIIPLELLVTLIVGLFIIWLLLRMVKNHYKRSALKELERLKQEVSQEVSREHNDEHKSARDSHENERTFSSTDDDEKKSNRKAQDEKNTVTQAKSNNHLTKVVSATSGMKNIRTKKVQDIEKISNEE